MTSIAALFGILRGALGATWLALLAMMPLFRRYALARPNARSSHRVPTPQGGGIGFIATTLAIGLAFAAIDGTLKASAGAFAILIGATALLGALDDLRPLGWRLRLFFQALLVGGMLALFPQEWRLLPELPLALERGLSLLAGLWFVNLSNFMDGIDAMLVAGFAPLALALGSGFLGLLPPDPLALAFGGALLGFLALNRPPARLFAGDSGSLASGLLVASLLYALASRHSLIAALILPLYFVMDATLTLLMRVRKGCALTEAHRDHAYQRAVDAGRPAAEVSAEVALLNIALGLLSGVALRFEEAAPAALALGIGACALLLHRFRTGRPIRNAP